MRANFGIGTPAELTVPSELLGNERCDLAGRGTGEPPTLANEMRLVGISGLQGQTCGRRIPGAAHELEKALKPKNAIERLWPVAEGVLALPAQGPLAHR